MGEDSPLHPPVDTLAVANTPLIYYIEWVPFFTPPKLHECSSNINTSLFRVLSAFLKLSTLCVRCHT